MVIGDTDKVKNLDAESVCDDIIFRNFDGEVARGERNCKANLQSSDLYNKDVQVNCVACGGTAGNGLCDGTEECVYQDLITDSMWAKNDDASRTWENAILWCDNLNYGGYTDWRLPTDKELLQAYVNRIYNFSNNPLTLNPTQSSWSATSRTQNLADAWRMEMGSGFHGLTGKANHEKTFCVRP